VSGAEVRLVPADLRTARAFSVPLGVEGEELQRFARTGSDGRFTLPEISAGEYRLEIFFPSGRVLHSEPFLVPPPREEEGKEPRTAVLDLGEFRPDTGAVVEVRVTDLEGLPVAGSQVGALQGTSPEDFVEFRGAVAADGWAQVEGLAWDKPLSITCLAPGFDRWSESFDELPPSVHCALSPLAQLTGRVLDGDEKPLAETMVLCRAPRSGRADPRDQTDAEGTFTLREVPPGECVLEVAAAGFRSIEFPLTLEPGELRQLEPILLEPAPEIVGNVRDASSDAVIAGAVVEVISSPGSGATRTDELGEFRLYAGGPRGARLVVRAEGYAEAQEHLSTETIEAAEPVKIRLSRGGHLLLKVWDEDGGGVCIGCRVSVSPNAGGYRLTDESGEALFGPLSPGVYGIQRPQVINRGSLVTVRGGQDRRQVEVREGETSVVELGQATESLTLRLLPEPGPGWWLEATAGGRSDVVWPGASGGYLLRRKSGVTLHLRLQKSGASGVTETSVPLPPVPSETSSPEVLVSLPETSVTGLIERDGEAVAGQPVLVASVDGERQAYAVTSGDGRFQIPYLPPGAYLVQTGGVVMPAAVESGSVSELGTLTVP
jgi:hypothetical protein